MTRIILVSAGWTEWREQGRLAGDTNLPLSARGQRESLADAEAVAAHAPRMIRCGPEQATRETAAIIARKLSLRVKAVDEMREMDLGTWEGLLVSDFEERFPKVSRQWRADAASVEPPDGESVPRAAARIEAGLKKIMKNYPRDTVVVVLGHFAHSIMRCRLEDGNFERFWDYVEGVDRWRIIEPPRAPAGKPTDAG